MKRFEGRVAFVTGASRGIGKGVAEKFAEEGAKIVIADVNEEALSETAAEFKEKGYEVLDLIVDVANAERVNEAMDEAVAKFGKVDTLINNAGILRDNLLFKMTDEDWDLVMDVHLKGSFNCARAAQKNMVENGFGRIVNLSSSSALGNRGQANYAAAKAGLQGFTKTLAIELGKFGITTNAIAPGFIQTDMTRQTAERQGINFDDMIENAKQRNPVGRGGFPSDIANAAAFFAMEDSSYVNGQVLYVAGGPLA